AAPGFSGNDVGPPAAVAVCIPLAAQAMANQPPLTLTGSAKVISTLASSATPDAPLAGAVEATAGARSVQLPGADAVLRGAGAPATKSDKLLSLSTQPAPTRKAAVVLLSAGAGPEPSKKFAPS